MTTLRIRRDILDEIVAHARDEHPLECCGLVAARRTDGNPSRLIKMRNNVRSETYFAFDPREQISVWRGMEAAGEEPVVIYHSHTNSRAYPSREDIDFAIDPEIHYLIVSTSEEPAVCCYRINGRSVAQENLDIVSDHMTSVVEEDGSDDHKD